MAQSGEIELKLEVPASQLGRLDRLPLLKGIKPNKSSTLQSVYFDTAKRKLRRRGLSLRVQRQDGRHVQTVKQQGDRSVGLFERDEWECDIDGRQPDFEAARSTALAPLLGKKLRHELKPIFETRVRRKVYPIHRRGSEI
jgi:inorganic triphosphatase YgiF